MRRPTSIAPPKGKLGVLTPGLGAVSTTFMAGVELVRTGAALPVGSVTQLATIRLGPRTERCTPLIREFVPLETLDNLVFGGWDIFPDTAITPSMLYALAAITSGVPFANGAPNLTVDIPALQELARGHNVPICGKDFKTGQTLLKTVLAPGFKARMLGLHGWFSTNILGNRDGEVLDDPDSFKTKEESKLGVLEYLLQPQLY